MISLGRRRDGCRVRWASGLGVDQGLLAACPTVASRKTAFAGASIPFGSREASAQAANSSSVWGAGRAGAIGGGRAGSPTPSR